MTTTTNLNADPSGYQWDDDRDRFPAGAPVAWETGGRIYRGISNGGVMQVRTLRGVEYWPVVDYPYSGGMTYTGVDPETVIN
jgi:hypothetical protein